MPSRDAPDPDCDDPPGAELDEEQHVQGLEPDRLHREEVAGHDPCGLGLEELRPCRSKPSWRRAEAVSSQQRPDGRGIHPDAELAQLTADPHATPSRVLPGHAQHERDDLGVDRWPARPAPLLAVGPLPSNQRAVPAHQRLGRDEKRRCPPPSGERPAGGGEQDPVTCGESGMAGLAPQDPKLMPKDQDLQILAAVASVREDEQAGEEADGQPEHEEHRGMVRNACSRRETEFPRPTRRLVVQRRPKGSPHVPSRSPP
jgi:hypothetical protein